MFNILTSSQQSAGNVPLGDYPRGGFFVEHISQTHMAFIGIDCSSNSSSVCIYENGVLAMQHSDMAYEQAQHILPMIKSALQISGLERGDIGAIAVGKGPGFFTGIRIALASAQGLSFGLGVPLYGVSTMDAFAHQANVTGDILVVLETKRSDFYVQPFKGIKPIGTIESVSAEQIIQQFFTPPMPASSNTPLHVIGNGRIRLQKILQERNEDKNFPTDTCQKMRHHIFCEGLPYLSAENVVKCAIQKIQAGENLETRPLYCNAPTTTLPKQQ